MTTLPHVRFLSSSIATIMLLGCGGEGVGNSDAELASEYAARRDVKQSTLGDQAMSDKARPWNRPDVKVYWPDPVRTIHYDANERKAVDTASGEYVVMRPGTRGELGRFVYGNEKLGFIAEGSYQTNWYPDDRTLVLEIKRLRTERGQPTRFLSRTQFNSDPIARLMRGHVEAAADFQPAQIVVIDSRPEATAINE